MKYLTILLSALILSNCTNPVSLSSDEIIKERLMNGQWVYYGKNKVSILKFSSDSLLHRYWYPLKNGEKSYKRAYMIRNDSLVQIYSESKQVVSEVIIEDDAFVFYNGHTYTNE